MLLVRPIATSSNHTWFERPSVLQTPSILVVGRSHRGGTLRCGLASVWWEDKPLLCYWLWLKLVDISTLQLFDSEQTEHQG